MSIFNLEKVEELNLYIDQYKEYLEINDALFNIYEGDVQTYLLNVLAEQLSPQSFDTARHRIAPINVLKKIVDKLATIYQQNVVRVVDGGTEQDEKLLEWFEEQMRVDPVMNGSDEFLNLFRSTLLQPYLHNGKPSLRAIPNNSYLVWSDDKIDPTNVTGVITFQGTKNKVIKNERSGGETIEEVSIYYAYTDDEFIIFNSDNEFEIDMMREQNNEDGVNTFGKIPFVYINKSSNLLIPKSAKDDLIMTLLIPVLLTDINYVAMFQSFSILYGIDVDDQGIVRAPSAFWSFRSNPDGETKPEIGTIDPQSDMASYLNLIQSEFAFWLESKGIKAGNIGNLTGENFASGISKIIDEMDTASQRQKSTVYYQEAETEMWDLIFNYMVPVWQKDPEYNNPANFSKTAKVVVNFPPQLPMIKRGELIEELTKELEAGFTTRFRAIQKLNPTMSDKEIELLMQEIDEERTITLEPEEPEEIEDINGREEANM